MATSSASSSSTLASPMAPFPTTTPPPLAPLQRLKSTASSHMHFPTQGEFELGGRTPTVDLPEDPEAVLEREGLEKADTFYVIWDEEDEGNPLLWSKRKKWYLTVLTSLLCFNATFASSLPSGAYNDIKAHFGISDLVTALVTAIFVGGYVIGPIIWAPLSEMYGRRIVFVGTFATYTLFIIPCAAAQNIETLLVCRFIGGVFAACSLTNAGGLVNDIWPPLQKGTPYALFNIAPNLGPQLAPLVSGFLADRYGFRPSFWVLFAFSAILQVLITFTLPETYAPYLLKLKARKLRAETNDSRYWAKLEREDWSPRAICGKVLARPLLMLVTEPIVLLVSLYLSCVYGILYLFFELYPAVFQDIHGMNPGVGSLPLICVGIGCALGLLSSPYFDRKYAVAYRANGCRPVPESRLLGLFFGGPLFAIGLFWFGFSAKRHWIAPTLSGLFTGFGIFWTFQSCLSYLGDCYMYYSASAFAAAQISRSFAGFGFPLFAKPMINRLGVDWTAALLGFVSFAFVPIPILFYRYGVRIRQASKFASESI